MKQYLTLNEELIEHTGVKSARCYQCGKCSAGCPLAEDMDLSSSMVMRMLQVEDEQMDRELLKSEAIWLCLSCEMCIGRCPMEVDIPKVMDYLRHKALEMKLQNKKASKGIIPFHRSFLDMVRTTGRSYELGLVVDYKLRSMKLMQDIMIAPKMLRRGKLPIMPEFVKGKKEIKQIFGETKK